MTWEEAGDPADLQLTPLQPGGYQVYARSDSGHRTQLRADLRSTQVSSETRREWPQCCVMEGVEGVIGLELDSIPVSGLSYHVVANMRATNDIMSLVLGKVLKRNANHYARLNTVLIIL